MFLTPITRALYKTIWSRCPMVVNIDQDTRMTWSNTILWLSKDGKNDVPIHYDNRAEIEKEVNHIVHTFNEIEKEETSNRMIHYLEMREEERRRRSIE